MIRLLLCLCGILFNGIVQAQNCPACEIAIPDNLPQDTVFLSAAATGQVGLAYDNDISFRLPLTTTPVSDENTPAGLNINQFEITGVANLPPGLTWTPSQTIFDPAELNDGCAKICGTPLVAGEYIMQVSLVATVLVIEAETILDVPITIAPRQSTTEGFTLRNGTGCGSTLVAFRNNVPSNEQEGFSYEWDFGNGQITDRENPLDVEYNEAGTYIVDYQAIVDTTGHFLTEVFIDAVVCDDFLGRPDLQVKIFDTLGIEVFASQALENVEPPLSIPTNFKIEAETYNLVVLDLDSGLGGDDDICGEFTLRPAATGIYADSTEDAQIRYQILHPTDTIRSQDTVVVFAVPTPPIITVTGALTFCAGDSVSLQSSYLENIQWYQDSMVLINENQAELVVPTAGNYYVEHTSADGCSSISDTLTVVVNDNPPVVEFSVDNNLLIATDTMDLATDTDLQWYLAEEAITAANTATFCIAIDGLYGLELTNAAGCTSRFSRQVVYDENFPNCVSDVVDIDDLGLNFQLYPNPASDVLNIALELRERADIQLVVFDNLGRNLFDFQSENALGEFNKSLPISDWEAGFYFLKIRLGERESMVKFIKK